VKPEIKSAKLLRRLSTPKEQVAWEVLRNRKFLGYKFRRQFPLPFEYEGRKKYFIADFFCDQLKLIVEIDGGIHDTREGADQARDEVLEVLGFKVFRIQNEELIDKESFFNKLKAVIPSPSPCRQAGRGG
jgi:very-short-patch-repair endonuclease